MLAALLVRAVLSTKYGDLYWDEMFSFYFGTLPLTEAVQYWFLETNPPFHMLLLHLWFSFVPQIPEYGRILSILVGTAGVGAIYYLGTMMSGKKAGVIAVIITTFSSIQIESSILARGYGLFFLLITLSSIWLVKILNTEKPNHRLYWWGGLTNLLLLMTHLTGVLLPIIQLITILATTRHRLKDWLWLWIIPGILAALWIIPSMIVKLQLPSLGAAWFLNIHTTPLKYLTGIGSLVIPDGSVLSIIGFVLFAVALVLGVKRLRTANVFTNLYLLVWALLPIMTAVAMDVWNIKFYFLALPAVAILLGSALERYNAKIVTVIVATIALCNIYSLTAIMPCLDWTDVRAKLTQLDPSKSCVVLDEMSINWLTLSRYMPDVNWHVYSPVNKTNNIAANTVLNNYAFYRRDTEELVTWWQRSGLQDSSCVVIFAEETKGVNMGGALQTLGWTKTAEQSVSLLPINRLEKYEKR